MKEDILEQIVDEYLHYQGYFTQHNIKFKPDPGHPDFITRNDSVHSDIDVLGIHPKRQRKRRVVAVSCKSWQAGFNPAIWVDKIDNQKMIGRRSAWQSFRELAEDKWAQAFIDKIEALTGSRSFTYVTAVTRLKGDKGGQALGEQHQGFREKLQNNPIKIWTLQDMAGEIKAKLTRTQASSQIGRLLQLFKAAGIID